jgi:hypothetical protein
MENRVRFCINETQVLSVLANFEHQILKSSSYKDSPENQASYKRLSYTQALFTTRCFYSWGDIGHQERA